ncbi:dehydrogenase/reductase SDR family member 11-like [Anneissia japonica]|uniref:dehydrogenase/reductase SDR family member 11-like n=1 Tax=Anneissia japonica TaxID=1529436 RepID=UPI0014255927|nr:dehydrogenase/reductase SDR family member 11-like [Anneissia japonica]
MAERWIGRVALVTGASSGIGEQVARKLVGHGMKVVGCVKDDVFHNLQAIADEVNSQNGTGLLHPVKCDVTKESEILAMFSEIKDKFGGVDICVNNAGLSIDSPLLSGKTEQWRYMMDVNVMGVAVCTREAVRQMMERGVDDGHIVFMNSLLGHTVHVGSDMGFYAGTKHAITALVEGFRQELRLKNSHIRVTSISPGKVDTLFYTNMFGKEKAKEMTKILKYLQPEDIANSIIHALHAPPHCQVQEIRIRPVEQS